MTPASNSDYWGAQLASLVRDPRNISDAEWKTIDLIWKHLNSDDENPDAFREARQVAFAIASGNGRIKEGPCGTRTHRNRARRFGGQWEARG